VPSQDPVCGIDVDESKARAAGRLSEYQGKTYFFDFDICKLVFDSDVAKDAGAGAGAETKTMAGSPTDTKEPEVPPGMVKDPVCGKVIPEGQAQATGKMSQYQGRPTQFRPLQTELR
jgi:YHS domain-containing protein